MKKKLSLLAILLCSNYLHAMMYHGDTNSVARRRCLNAQKVIDYRDTQKDCHTHEYCQQQKFESRLRNAINLGSTKNITSYFEFLPTFFNLYARRTDIASSLEYAAQLPYTQKRDGIIAYFLQEVKANYIKKPSCLLANAIKNRHLPIIGFIQTHFSDKKYIEWELIDAIRSNNIKKTHVLLAAGINPNKGIPSVKTEQCGVKINDPQGSDKALYMKYANHPLHMAVHLTHINQVKLLLKHNADLTIRDPESRTPLEVAIASIEWSWNIPKYHRQLDILELLVNALPEEMQPPSPDEYDLSHLPYGVQGAVKVSLEKKHIPLPPVVRMEDEQSNSDSTDINIFTPRSIGIVGGCLLLYCSWAVHYYPN